MELRENARNAHSLVSFPSLVSGFPADISRSRSIELLEEVITAAATELSVTEADDLNSALMCLRAEAEHACTEADVENAPIWWGRLLTQPLPFPNPPHPWRPCECLCAAPISSALSGSSLSTMKGATAVGGCRAADALPVPSSSASTAGAAASEPHPLLLCAHLLRLHSEPVFPFARRALLGAVPPPSATQLMFDGEHPFGFTSPSSAAETDDLKAALSAHLHNASHEVRVQSTLKLLERIASWTEFDVFQLTSLTNGFPLLHLAYCLFESYDLFDKLCLDRSKFVRFVLSIEHGCNFSGASMHNSVRAADVLQACHVLLLDAGLARIVSDFDLLATFLAALIHCHRHPGLSNHYLKASQDALSVLYNDVRAIENFACASAFRLLAEPGHDFLAMHDSVTRQKIRQQTIALVFATNTSDHVHFLEAVDSAFLAAPTSISSTHPNEDNQSALPAPSPFMASIDFTSKADPRADLVLKLIIKAASVSTAARAWTMCARWSRLQMEEYYAQGDLERSSGLVISAYMDREAPNEAKFHLSQLQAIALPLFVSLEKCSAAGASSSLAAARQRIEMAIERWSELEEDE